MLRRLQSMAAKAARYFAWRDYDFFLDPAANSGFGDRLVEIWSALTVAEILRPGARTAIRWTESGYETKAFVTEYAPLFAIAGADFVDARPPRAWDIPRQYDANRVNDVCVRRLIPGLRQIRLRSAHDFGRSSPRRLLADAPWYGLPPALGLDNIAAVYRRVAAGTVPAPSVAQFLPADLGERVGIHIRLSDKIVAQERPHEMSLDRWKRIEAGGLAHLEHGIKEGEKFFVCSEDTDYRDGLMRRIREQGGDVIAHDPAPGETPKGFDALVDFFALARCRRIVQLTRYSNFSIAAAIVGGIELVNFDPPADGAENQLAIWEGALPIRHLGEGPTP